MIKVHGTYLLNRVNNQHVLKRTFLSMPLLLHLLFFWELMRGTCQLNRHHLRLTLAQPTWQRGRHCSLCQALRAVEQSREQTRPTLLM